MKIKFITSIYSDLYGTEFGGRINRKLHYRYSLLSLLDMTDADFLCYTSDREIDDLKDFFYIKHNISEDKLKFKIFHLSDTKFKDIINQYKDVDKTKKSDRCVEIQFSKFHWWWNEDKSYDYYYWIDAGLSHCGLIPNKYLISDDLYGKYYISNIFNNSFLKNLIEFSKDKFFIISKENDLNYWSTTVDRKWYNEYDRSIHVIGGLFGGKKELWDNVVNIFEGYLHDIITEDQSIPHEEQIMSLMRVNHKDLFVEKYFETWNHPDAPLIGHTPEFYEKTKSFYKVLEELNNI